MRTLLLVGREHWVCADAATPAKIAGDSFAIASSFFSHPAIATTPGEGRMPGRR